jgi:hypothetical protein
MALLPGPTGAPATETSIVIHLWIEPDGFWRGRVSDGDAERHFEDGQTLVEFIGDRLVTRFGVALPARRLQA